MDTRNPTRLIEKPIKNGQRWPRFLSTDEGPMTIQEIANVKNIRIDAMYKRLETLEWDNPRLFLHRRAPKYQQYDMGVGNDEWRNLGDLDQKRLNEVKVGWWEYQQ